MNMFWLVGAGVRVAVPGQRVRECVVEGCGFDSEAALGFAAVDDEGLRELVAHLVELSDAGFEEAEYPEEGTGSNADLYRGAEIFGNRGNDLTRGSRRRAGDVEDFTGDVVASPEHREGSRSVLSECVGVG